MKAITLILLTIISTNYFGQIDFKTHFNYDAIITEKFKNSDSVIIRIEIQEAVDILSYGERAFLTLFILPNQSYMVYQPFGGETRQMLASQELLLQSVIDFEKNAKEIHKTDCINKPDAMHVHISISIQGEFTSFRYCKDEWDGIQIFLNSAK